MQFQQGSRTESSFDSFAFVFMASTGNCDDGHPCQCNLVGLSNRLAIEAGASHCGVFERYGLSGNGFDAAKQTRPQIQNQSPRKI